MVALFVALIIISFIKIFMKSVFFIAVAGFFLMYGQKDLTVTAPLLLPFEVTPDTIAVMPGAIDEASGIADSWINPGFIWVQQDSGNPPELTLLSYKGLVQKKIALKGIGNRDWEDMAIGNGPLPGENYIYLADTGDNTDGDTDYAIYRFIEPSHEVDTIFTSDKITFQYPDGPHDAEAIIIDHQSKDIYILTKMDSLSKIYLLPFPQSTVIKNTAIYKGKMTFSGVTSAAMSADGSEILVKNYTNVYYWKRKTGEPVLSALQRMPVSLGYVLEPQGEAICFKNDNSGFYTLSEKPFFAAFVWLNLYKRKE